MKRILYIARNELYSLYCSPIAWAMMILFFIMTTNCYLNWISASVSAFERGGEELFGAKNSTDTLLANQMGYPGIFFNVISSLYLFLPLITMGLISKETSSGTIKLIYSSPIKVREMVLGKFTAMIVLMVAMMSLLAIHMVFMCHSLTNADYGHIFASYLGLFLVLAVYSAIGLFISSLTSYQVVAGVITFGIFAMLGNADKVGQNIEFFKNVTYYLSFTNRARQLISGLLNTRDVLYFVILTTVFLSFTIIRIKSASESIPVYRKMLRYLAVVAIAFVAGFISNMPRLNLYADSTRDQIHTITPPTQASLAKLDGGPMEIITFANLLSSRFSTFVPAQTNFLNYYLWEKYVRFKPDIKLRYVYYYGVDSSDFMAMSLFRDKEKTLDDIAKEQAKGYGINLKRFLTPEQVNKLVDVNDNSCRNFFLFKYKNKTAICQTYNDMIFFPREDEIAATLNRLTEDPPKVYFLVDEIERNPFLLRERDYPEITADKYSRFSLRTQGYDFDTLSLIRNDIPKDIRALYIADPRVPIAKSSLDKIYRYIQEGGDLWIASEPDRRDVIKPILDTLGIRLHDGILLQDQQHFASDMIYNYLTDTAKLISPQWAEILKDEVLYYGDTTFRAKFSGSTALEVDPGKGFHVTPLLYTDSTLVWNRLAPIDEDSLEIKVNRLPSDENRRFVTQVLLQRKINGKHQKIVVSGDADFVTKPVFNEGYLPRQYNFQFGFHVMSIFGEGKFPANTIRPQTDNSYDIKVADLWKQRTLLYYVVLPILVLVGGVILIRRNRK